MNTASAGRTVSRLIDAFPPTEQAQIRAMLSESLRGVVSQRLVLGLDGKRVPAVELLVVTGGVANLICEGKLFQIPSQMQMGRHVGMKTLDDSLRELIATGKIDVAEARKHSRARDDWLRRHDHRREHASSRYSTRGNELPAATGASARRAAGPTGRSRRSTSPTGRSLFARQEGRPDGQPHRTYLFCELRGERRQRFHLSTGRPAMFRLHGEMEAVRPYSSYRCRNPHHDRRSRGCRRSDGVREERRPRSLAYAIPGVARFRCNLLRQDCGPGAVFRIIPEKILTLEDLKCPPALSKLADARDGLGHRPHRQRQVHDHGRRHRCDQRSLCEAHHHDGRPHRVRAQAQEVGHFAAGKSASTPSRSPPRSGQPSARTRT